jgi:cytochrome c-type biogenesis protein CcmH/NrfG
MALNRRVQARLARGMSAGCALLILLAVLAACGKNSYTAAEHLERAREFSAKNDPAAAIIEVKNALQQEPEDGEARWMLGMLHLEVMDGATAHAELFRCCGLRFWSVTPRR